MSSDIPARDPLEQSDSEDGEHVTEHEVLGEVRAGHRPLDVVGGMKRASTRELSVSALPVAITRVMADRTLESELRERPSDTMAARVGRGLREREQETGAGPVVSFA